MVSWSYDSSAPVKCFRPNFELRQSFARLRRWAHLRLRFGGPIGERDALQTAGEDAGATFAARYFRGDWFHSAWTALLFGLLICSVGSGLAQTAPQTSSQPAASSPYSSIKSFRIVQEKDGPAVEILSSKPLIPAIQALSNPARLVIDLPNARLDTRQRRISVQANQISTLRADQFQQDPPVARVVVDLLAPRAYTWAAAGNRLLVHLGKAPATDANTSPFQAPSALGLTSAPPPVVAAVHASGPLAVAGNALASGSSITAGADTAVLSLARGGEVHVCPGTTVSVTPSQNGRNVMLGVNTGALETHYSLDASSDSVITPDFRILLSGPGEFHYAISTDTHGNTCVRSLPGNTASAVVTELMGDRTYQVKAADQLVFRSGQLDRVDMAVPIECGCPPPRQPVLRAANDAAAVSEVPAANAKIPNAASAELARDESAVPERLPGSQKVSVAANDVHVQVEAPFVFRGNDPKPAPIDEVRILSADSRPLPPLALSDPLPPSHPGNKPAGTETAAAPRHGFFGKLRGFFAAIFR